MKAKRLLKGQKSVKKKKRPRLLPAIWTLISGAGALTLKAVCLLVGLVFISVLFLSLYEFLVTSPYLRLEKVVMAGVDRGLKDEILELSGLSPEQGLLAIDLRKLKKTLETHPWVKSVDLEKRLPHTLLIRAEMEHPRAVVVLDTLHYMNAAGRVFKAVSPGEDLDYPVVTGVSREAEEGLHLAARILEGLESEEAPWSLEALSEIHVEEDGQASLYFRGLQAAVRLRAEELKQKMADLRMVVEDLERSGRIHRVRGINLAIKDGAVVSFQKG